jgi:uncharacterized protein (DUF4415 family)
MQKSDNIVRYTAKEIDEMIARGEDKTDWDRVANMTEEEIEQNAIDDYAENGEPNWDGPIWVGTLPGMSIPKYRVDLYLDEDVLTWFKAQNGNMQFRINDILRQYMEDEKGRSG